MARDRWIAMVYDIECRGVHVFALVYDAVYAWSLFACIRLGTPATGRVNIYHELAYCAIALCQVDLVSHLYIFSHIEEVVSPSIDASSAISPSSPDGISSCDATTGSSFSSGCIA